MKKIKSKLKTLKTHTENLWKELILKRDIKCRRCGGHHMLQAHHIRSRGNMSTKFDPDNGILLCRDCHCWVTFAEDEERRIFHIKQIGEKEYQELCDRAKRIKDWNVGELEDLIKDLQEKIKRLNNTASI